MEWEREDDDDLVTTINANVRDVEVEYHCYGYLWVGEAYEIGFQEIFSTNLFERRMLKICVSKAKTRQAW